MKKSILITALFIGTSLMAQPIIQDGNSRPLAGFTVPVGISSTATTPGSAGANQSWDYSILTFTPLGTFTVIDPTTSPYATSFSGANYCMELDVNGTKLYTYQNYGAGKMEELSSSMAAPGSGNDYSPNPATRLVFPMSMGTTASDTWQKVGDSPNPVTITYDAYGNFKTPYNTYTNVVRVANDYGSNEIDYSWFVVNPLRLLAVHKHSDNSLVLLDGISMGMDESLKAEGISVYPNPVADKIYIAMESEAVHDLTFEVYDMTGVKVLEAVVAQPELDIERGSLPTGVYLYQLKSVGEVLQSGKLSFE